MHTHGYHMLNWISKNFLIVKIVLETLLFAFTAYWVFTKKQFNIKYLIQRSI